MVLEVVVPLDGECTSTRSWRKRQIRNIRMARRTTAEMIDAPEGKWNGVVDVHRGGREGREGGQVCGQIV
jgi:hypothetical protein